MSFAFCFTFVPDLLQPLTLYTVYSAAANCFNLQLPTKVLYHH